MSGIIDITTLKGSGNDDCIEAWRINIYWLIGGYAMSGPQKQWINRLYAYDTDPHGRKGYMSGRRGCGEVFYRTEEAAWLALDAEFDKWVAERKDFIARRGAPKPKPVKKRKSKSSTKQS